MDNTTKLTGRGGPRPNSGRPKGTGNAISVKTLLEAIEAKTGVPFEESVAEGYREALLSGDKHLQHKWTNLIMSKVMSTQTKIEVEDHRDRLAEKQEAFKVALANMIAQEQRNKQTH